MTIVIFILAIVFVYYLFKPVVVTKTTKSSEEIEDVYLDIKASLKRMNDMIDSHRKPS